MKNCQPLVSIVTPVYNGSAYIEELIVSALDQDYPRMEHIIIDDGSDDNGATVQILRRYSHLRWWSRPNRGAYATINEGLSSTTGDLVTVICADDKYACRTAISAAVQAWSTSRNCDAVYGETITIGEDGRPLDIEPPRGGPLWLFPYYPVVAHCSLFVTREKVVDAGLWFDESLPYTADYDWILRMIIGGYRFRRLRRPIAMFRQHPMQRSTHISPARDEENRRVRDRYGKGNPLLSYLVRKWVTLTRAGNLVRRRGVGAVFREVRARCNWLTQVRHSQATNDGSAARERP